MNKKEKKTAIEEMAKTYDWFLSYEPFIKAIALKKEIEDAIDNYEILIAKKGVKTYKKYNRAFTKALGNCQALKADVLFVKRDNLSTYLEIIWGTDIFNKYERYLKETSKGDIDYFLRIGNAILCDIRFAASTKKKNPLGYDPEKLHFAEV